MVRAEQLSNRRQPLAEEREEKRRNGGGETEKDKTNEDVLEVLVRFRHLALSGEVTEAEIDQNQNRASSCDQRNEGLEALQDRQRTSGGTHTNAQQKNE